MTNVPNGSSALWAHVVMSFFTSAVVWAVLWRATARFRTYKWEAAVSCAESMTVLVKGGVRPDATKDDILRWLRGANVPGVVDVLVVEDKRRYLDLLTKWRTAVREHDRITQLAKLRQRGTVPCCLKCCPGGPCCPSPVEVCRRGCRWRGMTHQQVTAATLAMMQAKHALVDAMADHAAASKVRFEPSLRDPAVFLHSPRVPTPRRL